MKFPNSFTCDGNPKTWISSRYFAKNKSLASSMGVGHNYYKPVIVLCQINLVQSEVGNGQVEFSRHNLYVPLCPKKYDMNILFAQAVKKIMFLVT